MSDQHEDSVHQFEVDAESSHGNKITAECNQREKNKSTNPFLKFLRRIAILCQASGRGGSEDIGVKLVKYLDQNQEILEAYIMQSVTVNQIESWLHKKINLENQGEPEYANKEILTTQRGTLKTFLLNFETKFNKKQRDNLSTILELAQCIISSLSVDAYRIYRIDSNGLGLVKLLEIDSLNMTETTEVKVTNAGDDVVQFVRDVVNKQKCLRLSRGNNVIFPKTPINAKEANHLLYQPLLSFDGKMTYVFEMWRIKHKFDDRDEEMSANIVTAFQYCNLYLNKQRECNMSDVLLDVVKYIFKEMGSLDQLIESILKTAQELVSADRASLFLVDNDKSELVSTLFDLTYNHGQDRNSTKPIRMPMHLGIAGYVASSGKTLNISDAYSDHRFNSEVDKATGYKTKSILCMPIKIRGKVIGVVEMVNKLNNHKFDKKDEIAFEKFSIFFGLALNNARLYDKMKRNEQRYKVALDVLSYHNTCKDHDVQEVVNYEFTIPSNFDDYYLDPYAIDSLQKCKAAIKMFDNLFDLSKFDTLAVTKFILTVKKNYRSVPYHNFDHGWSVAHSMYLILKNDHEQRFHYKMRLALFIACLCHDLDHRGYNNNYLNWTESPLAAMYSSSPLEHHHFSITVIILQQEGHNIFSHLPSEDYKEILEYIKQCILATDLATFPPTLTKLEEAFSDNAENQSFDWEIPSNRYLAMTLSMTAADLSASAKPWDVQIKTVEVIFEEFYDQGDKEREAGRAPVPMMDRKRPEERATSQVWFLKNICVPCYSMLYKIFPKTEPMYRMAVENLHTWESL